MKLGGFFATKSSRFSPAESIEIDQPKAHHLTPAQWRKMQDDRAGRRLAGRGPEALEVMAHFAGNRTGRHSVWAKARAKALREARRRDRAANAARFR